MKNHELYQSYSIDRCWFYTLIVNFPPKIEKKSIFFVIFFRGENTDGLTVSVDGAWQKRGSCRSFDSLSGSYN